MAGGAIPGIFSLTLGEDEIAKLSAMPSEHAVSNTAALYILSSFFVSLVIRFLADLHSVKRWKN
jgi:hypothetical protein